MTLPMAVPARSHMSNDGAPGSLLQMAGSAGGPSPLGTSPAMGGPSPGLGVAEDHGMMAGGQAGVAPGTTAVVSVFAAWDWFVFLSWSMRCGC
jgi:hypothetical protein